jgi:hypothetical protein
VINNKSFDYMADDDGKTITTIRSARNAMGSGGGNRGGNNNNNRSLIHNHWDYTSHLSGKIDLNG